MPTLTQRCSGIAATLTLALALATAAAAELPSLRQAPRPVDASEHGVGRLVADVSFTDLEGLTGKLSDYHGQTVVVACGTISCPLSKRYAPKLSRLSKELERDNVVFLLVNVAEDETALAIREFAKTQGFTCRIVVDPKLTLASALGALVTTDSFVVDGARTLQYRGSVDDQYGFGYALDEPRTSYLEQAVKAVRAGKRPTVRATTGPGCALVFPDGRARVESTVPATYNGQIARILQDSCQPCHRPGEAGPFPLLSYADVRGKRGAIKVALESHFMPPWFATSGGPFTNERTLRDVDRQLILDWVAADCPEGAASEAPVTRVWPEGWQIGEPDVVITIPRTYKIPAEGTIAYKNCKVVTDFPEDRWIQAMEVRPSAPQHVHHVLVFLEYPREHPRASEQREYQGGLTGYFAGMVPGQTDITFPPGLARFLPKGAVLHFQIHYTTNGSPAEDRTRMAMIFTDGRPAHEISTRGIANRTFELPPGARHEEVTATVRFREPGTLFGFNPHMHLRGSAFRFELLYPDGQSEIVLDVPRFDFNWQLFYELRNPIAVPAGAKLRATGWFDNSAENPANPDPTRFVHFGEQTWEEMMIGYYSWVPGEMELPEPIAPPADPEPEDDDYY